MEAFAALLKFFDEYESGQLFTGYLQSTAENKELTEVYHRALLIYTVEGGVYACGLLLPAGELKDRLQTLYQQLALGWSGRSKCFRVPDFLLFWYVH